MKARRAGKVGAPNGPALRPVTSQVSNMRVMGAITILLLFRAGGPATESTNLAAATLTRFNAMSGSKVTLKGDRGLGEWHAEVTLVGGFLEVEAGFPTLARARETGARVSPRGEAFIPVRNLKAVGESREEYNEQITGIMQRMLHADDHPRIYFRLSQLEAGVPTFVVGGDLVIAGVSNRVSFPITVKNPEAGVIEISGKTTIKQSDFKIIPRPGGFRCFGADPDPVEIAFDWFLKETPRR
jgi:hypothetical protein